MIITENIKLARIFYFTWKNDLFLLLCCTLSYLANAYLISVYLQLPTFVPTLLGTALAFFIGFNNNQAYDRWWEARKIWGGLVNDSRTWARGLLYYSTAPGEELSAVKDLQKIMILRHLAFLHALRFNLRGVTDDTYKNFLSPADLQLVKGQSNIHNAILGLQSRDLEYMYQKGYINDFRFIQLNQSLIDFCNGMGMSERIKNTIFPTTYHFFTQVFIWIFVVVLTLSTADTLGMGSIFLSWLLGFVFHTSHFIGRSLVNPFYPLITCVPLNQITRTIEINLLEMLGERDIPEPVKPIDGEYIL